MKWFGLALGVVMGAAAVVCYRVADEFVLAAIALAGSGWCMFRFGSETPGLEEFLLMERADFWL